MDFDPRVPKIAQGHDFILVVVDRTFKMTHFIDYKKTTHASHLVNSFLRMLSNFMDYTHFHNV